MLCYASRLFVGLWALLDIVIIPAEVGRFTIYTIHISQRFMTYCDDSIQLNSFLHERDSAVPQTCDRLSQLYDDGSTKSTRVAIREYASLFIKKSIPKTMLTSVLQVGCLRKIIFPGFTAMWLVLWKTSSSQWERCRCVAITVLFRLMIWLLSVPSAQEKGIPLITLREQDPGNISKIFDLDVDVWTVI